MPSSVRLVSLNIERDKHFETFLPFLIEQAADYVCLQEVLERDLPRLELSLKATAYFAPITRYVMPDNQLATVGIAILATAPIADIRREYYSTNGRPPGSLMPYRSRGDRSHLQHMVISGVVDLDGHKLRLATTHFPVSDNGTADERQRRVAPELVKVLDKYPELIFCGDLNAPRGREIFDVLSANLRDNIPTDVQTTLDQNLHRVKGLIYVVDALLSRGSVQIDDVQVVDGVSDHCAVVCNVSRSK